MKRIALFLIGTLIASASIIAQQTEKELTKEIKSKATRQARKEAKKLTKDGWKVNAASIPLSKMLESAWMKSYTVDDKGAQRFISADGNAVAESKATAEMQALELAKLNLAGQIETKVTSLVDVALANQQLNIEEAASVTKVVQNAKNLIATELGYVDPVFKIYKPINKTNVEFQVRVFYDTAQSLKIAKKVIKQELEEELKVNEKQLENLMGIF